MRRSGFWRAWLVATCGLITCYLAGNKLALAQDCALLVKLQSPYLQQQPLYLDELKSQPVVNHQLCLNSSEFDHPTQRNYLELFADNGRHVQSLAIFSDYSQLASVTISTADLLSKYCLQCQDLASYEDFTRQPQVVAIAAAIDDMLLARPQLTLLDALNSGFHAQLAELADYRPGTTAIAKAVQATSVAEQEAMPLNTVANASANPAANTAEKVAADVQLPHTLMPIYDGEELINFMPEGLALQTIQGLPLASYRIAATPAVVTSFYQTHFPQHQRVDFNGFTMLVAKKLPIADYSPAYMAIPHLVIGADAADSNTTLLQITYQPVVGLD